MKNYDGKGLQEYGATRINGRDLTYWGNVWEVRDAFPEDVLTGPRSQE